VTKVLAHVSNNITTYRSIWILRFPLAAAFDDSDGIIGRDSWKQEKLRRSEECFLLTSPSIEPLNPCTAPELLGPKKVFFFISALSRIDPASLSKSGPDEKQNLKYDSWREPNGSLLAIQRVLFPHGCKIFVQNSPQQSRARR